VRELRWLSTILIASSLMLSCAVTALLLRPRPLPPGEITFVDGEGADLEWTTMCPSAFEAIEGDVLWLHCPHSSGLGFVRIEPAAARGRALWPLPPPLDEGAVRVDLVGFLPEGDAIATVWTHREDTLSPTSYFAGIMGPEGWRVPPTPLVLPEPEGDPSSGRDLRMLLRFDGLVWKDGALEVVVSFIDTVPRNHTSVLRFTLAPGEEVRRDDITPSECAGLRNSCGVVGAIAPAPEREWVVFADASHLELPEGAPAFEPTDTVALAPGRAPTRADFPENFNCATGMGSCVDLSTLGVLAGFTFLPHSGLFIDQRGRVRPLDPPDSPRIDGLEWSLGMDHHVVDGVLEPSFYWWAVVEPGAHLFARNQLTVVRPVDEGARMRLLDDELPDDRGVRTLIGREGDEVLEPITQDRAWTRRTMTDASVMPGGRSGKGLWLVSNRGLIVSLGEEWRRDDPAGVVERLRDWDDGEGQWFWWRFATAALGGPICVALAWLRAWWRARRDGEEPATRRDRFLKTSLVLLLAWALIPLWGSLPALLEALY
jgi:hypothetical protein